MLYALYGREKKVLGRISVGMLYTLIVLFMSVLIGLFSISYVRNYWFDPALEMSNHLGNLFTNVKNIGHKRAGNAN